SSTGPQIFDVQVIGGQKVVVRCSPASRIFVTGSGYHSRTAWGNGIIEAELDISTMHSPYIRVTVRDDRGGRAWSNPIWL
ncbi:MAG: phosphotransferase, partial [Anaerolineae bacterium]|nr:phosphotransferase [Anaerolineae bacterium]